MSTPSEPLQLLHRWMIRRDIDEILAIEAQSFAAPWTEDELLRALRIRSVIGMVTVDKVTDRLLGYFVYQLRPYWVEVLHLAVHPAYRRRGVGTAMLGKLQSKLHSHRRRFLRLNTRVTNYTAQSFLRRHGFLVDLTLPGSKEQGGAFYRWMYCCPEPWGTSVIELPQEKGDVPQ